MGAAQEHGKVYVQFQSADGSRSATPIEADTHTIGHAAPASATDRRQFYPLAFKHGGVKLAGDGKIRLLFKSTAADVIESEESAAYIDCTLINQKTGAMQPVTVALDDMTGFTSGGTVDLTLIAGQTTEVAYYTVPSGSDLVLGHPSGLGKAYVYFGDDT